MERKPANRKIGKWLLNIAIIFLALCMLLAVSGSAAYFVLEKKYEFRIYPHIAVGGTDIGGLSVEDAEKVLGDKITALSQTGIPVSFNEKNIPFLPVVTSPDADLAYDLVSFDMKKNIEDAYDLGRSDKTWNNIRSRIGLLFGSKEFDLEYKLNEVKIIEFFKDSFPEAEKKARDAELAFEDGSAFIKEEEPGHAIDFPALFSELNVRLRKMDQAPIALKTKVEEPAIKKSELSEKDLDTLAQSALDLAPLTITQGKNK